MSQVDDIKERLHMYKVGQEVQQNEMAVDVEYLLNVFEILQKDYIELTKTKKPEFTLGEHHND